MIKKNRVTTLQTLWNSLTFPWQCAALTPMLINDYEGWHHYAYTCSYALFLKEMLMFRYTVAMTSGVRVSTNWMPLNTHMNANIHLVMNSFGTLFHDKIFSLTFPWLLTTSLTFPWHVSNSLTFPGFPDKWSPWMKGQNKSKGSSSHPTAPILWLEVTTMAAVVQWQQASGCWLSMDAR